MWFYKIKIEMLFVNNPDSTLAKTRRTQLYKQQATSNKQQAR